jgi:hypothetical protein
MTAAFTLGAGILTAISPLLMKCLCHHDIFARASLIEVG